MISTLFPYLNHITSRKARSGDAAPQVPGSHRAGPDHLSLSEEALKYDDRDRAIDEYYANLAEQRGADDPDVQLFTQMMGNITKSLKDVDKMDGDSAMKLFANTMAEAREDLAEKGLSGSVTSLKDVPEATKPAQTDEKK